MSSLIFINVSKFTILCTIWLEYSWERFLILKQIQKIKETNYVPVEIQDIMTADVFELTKSYTIPNLKLELRKNLFEVLLSSFLIYFDILLKLWNISKLFFHNYSEVLISLLWVFLLSSLTALINFPLDMFEALDVENNFGMDKESIECFLKKKIISFLTLEALCLPLTTIIIVIVRSGGNLFFFWLWITTSILSNLTLNVLPRIIPFMFHCYIPLEQGNLRRRIESLTKEINFPLTEIYTVKSKCGNDLGNIYIFSLLRKKYIFISEIILNIPTTTNNQIIAFLCHELGHWYHNHVIKNLIIIYTNIFMWFYVFWLFFHQNFLYESLGFHDEKPILIGLLVVIYYLMLPYNILMTFITVSLSRQFEFEADEFVVSLGKGTDLKNALTTLYAGSLTFPIHDEMYAKWHFSHPSLFERIQNIDLLLRQ